MPWATLAVIAACLAVLVQTDRQPAFVRNAGYERLEFGPYPNQTFLSNPNVTAPVFNILTPAADGVAQADYLFLGPHGKEVGRQWPTIVNATDLSVMWTGAGDFGEEAFDVRVQSYKGKDYLTFWSGQDSGTGSGMGRVYMVRFFEKRETSILTKAPARRQVQRCIQLDSGECLGPDRLS